MTKTLKDLFEVYKPKSPDEQKFVDKHVTIKHKDRNGNGDDVFKGNTKYIKRKEERHGYDVNDDEKVYEEVEELDELSTSTLKKYSSKASKDLDVQDRLSDYHWDKEMSGRVDRDKESTVDHRERGKQASAQASRRFKGLQMAKKKLEKAKDLDESYAELEEKKLTPAEMKKREEIAKAMERENPGMDKSKKMAIATATAKRVAEEAEELDELDDKTLQSYSDKSFKAASKAISAKNRADNADDFEKASRTADKRTKGLGMATKKLIAKMPKDEQVDELSKGTLGSYVNKAAERIGTQGVTAGLKIAADEKSSKNFKTMDKRQKGIATAVKKLTKEEIINKAIDKYMPELEDYVPMTQEEKLVAKLEHLPEAHVLTLLGLYENLNEDNRNKMMIAIDTQEGINSLIDFAIQNNRGE